MNYRLDRMLLRQLVSGRRELTAYERLAKATARPTANAAIVWQHYTTSTYKDGDLPGLGTREALQNGVDAIRAAVRAHKLKAGDGRFSVTWDPSARSLSWEDNGIGMDVRTISDVFLSIGESGKAGATSSEEAAGGFGVAKAVILGTSPTFRWELRTRDNLAEAKGRNDPVQIYDQPFFAGTRITVFDVAQKFDDFYDDGIGKTLPLLERLKMLLGANDLDGITLRLNGEVVPRLFERRKGSRLVTGGDWGEGTTAIVKGYKRSDRRGAFYIRLNGLFMYIAASNSRKLPLDVVVDLTSTLRPGVAGYPLNAAREGLQGLAGRTFENVKRDIEAESEAAANQEGATVIDPEEGTPIYEGTLKAFEDPEFAASMAKAATGIADYFAAQTAQSRPPVTSKAPPGSPLPKMVNPFGTGTEVEGANAVEMIRQLLGTADKSLSPEEPRALALTPAVEGVLQRAGQAKLNAADVATVVEAVERVNEAAVGPRGGGLLQIAEVSKVHLALAQIAEVAPPPPKNPFGSLAGIRIAKSFDTAKARAFQKKFEQWLPMLAAWDGVVRLLCAEANIRRRYYPGFLLDDTANGMVAVGRRGSVVYVNPFRFGDAIRAHRERPIAIASWIHGLACHELTHLDGRMSEWHNENFSIARESLQKETAHLIEPISVLLRNVLKLPANRTVQETRLAELESELAKCKKKTPEHRELREQLARLQEQLAAANLAASQASARVAESRCPCRDASPDDAEPSGEDRMLATPASVLEAVLAKARAVLVPSSLRDDEFDDAVAPQLPALTERLAQQLKELPWGGYVLKPALERWRGQAVRVDDGRRGVVVRLLRGGIAAEVQIGDETMTLRGRQLRLADPDDEADWQRQILALAKRMGSELTEIEVAEASERLTRLALKSPHVPNSELDDLFEEFNAEFGYGASAKFGRLVAKLRRGGEVKTRGQAA